MSEEQVEHIFDRFYRVDSSNSSVQGVGLGMSIVKHIIDAHEGSINVSSRLGEGTEVTVNLPVRARGLISGQGKFSVGG